MLILFFAHDWVENSKNQNKISRGKGMASFLFHFKNNYHYSVTFVNVKFSIYREFAANNVFFFYILSIFTWINLSFLVEYTVHFALVLFFHHFSLSLQISCRPFKVIFDHFWLPTFRFTHTHTHTWMIFLTFISNENINILINCINLFS